MPKKKRVLTVLKQRLHPFLSYAALLGVGAIAVSATGSLAGANTETAASPAAAAAIHRAAKPAAPADLAKLKAAATEFAAQLSVIKSQVAELEKYGRVPPAALMGAIDQGDRLVASIVNAQTLSDIGDPAPAATLQTIGAVIAGNSKF
jgi:hypothetical protein